MASASIGQVHRATLADGRRVAVKVQHPDIVRRITDDLVILTELAGLAEKFLPEFRPYRPVALVAEFEHAFDKILPAFGPARTPPVKRRGPQHNRFFAAAEHKLFPR